MYKKGDIESLKIPIPSLERQKEIVEYCEYNDTLIKQLEKEIENNKRLAQQFITGIVKSQELYTSSVNTQTIQDKSVDDLQENNTNVVIEPPILIQYEDKKESGVSIKRRKPKISNIVIEPEQIDNTIDYTKMKLDEL